MFLLHGDCREVLKQLADNSVDTVITDPPYELKFMGRAWDASGVAFDPATWAGVLRVCKPGAFLLAFGSPRTVHRLACAIEDAGFLLRDTIMWVYGQGMKKGLDISKAIDEAGGKSTKKQAELLECSRKTAGLSRDDLAQKIGCTAASVHDWECGRARAKGQPVEYIVPSKEYRNKLADLLGYSSDERRLIGVSIDRRADGSVFSLGHTGQITGDAVTDTAKLWSGYGTGLKPAWEPIVVAMKPLDGTFVDNALAHGVAGLNIDGARVGTEIITQRQKDMRAYHGNKLAAGHPTKMTGVETQTTGRWPANLVLSHTEDCRLVGYADDEGYVINRFKDGAKPFGGGAGHEYETEKIEGGKREVWACPPGCPVRILDDQAGIKKSGKAPKTGFVRHTDKTRNTYQKGWKGTKQEPSVLYGDKGGPSRFFYTSKVNKKERNLGLPEGVINSHPTLKPIALMEYLCILTKTPTGGVVLDPFMGSGTTGVACMHTGRPFIGIELEKESYDIAGHRIRFAHNQANSQIAEVPKRVKSKKAKKKKKKQARKGAKK